MKTEESRVAERELEIAKNVRRYVLERVAEVIEAKDINLIVSEGKLISEQLERGSKFKDILKEAQETLRAEYKRLYAKGFRAGHVATQKQEPKSGIPEGTFTVERQDGSYETIRIETIRQGGLAGKTIVSYLNGPDNTRNFQGFGFVSQDRKIHLWKRFSGIDHRWVSAARIVLGTEDPGVLREAYASRSKRCSRCGRELTVPASLHRGLGPECATKI